VPRPLPPLRRAAGLIYGFAPTPVRRPRLRAETLSVKMCPHCAEELPDEATVCPTCRKDPAVAPAWAAPRPPREAGSARLGNVWGPNGVLPTSEHVPAPYKTPEPARAGVPATVWASLILGWGWGWVAPVPSGVAGLIVPAGYVVGLIFGIWGEVQASDRRGRMLATLAIIVNGFNLAWTLYGILWYRLALRG
jgi:hypothetical protein